MWLWQTVLAMPFSHAVLLQLGIDVFLLVEDEAPVGKLNDDCQEIERVSGQISHLSATYQCAGHIARAHQLRLVHDGCFPPSSQHPHTRDKHTIAQLPDTTVHAPAQP